MGGQVFYPIIVDSLKANEKCSVKAMKEQSRWARGLGTKLLHCKQKRIMHKLRYMM